MRSSICAQSWLSVPPAPAWTVSFSSSSERGSPAVASLRAMTPLELLTAAAPARVVATHVVLRVDMALLDDRHRVDGLAVWIRAGGQRLQGVCVGVLVVEIAA